MPDQPEPPLWEQWETDRAARRATDPPGSERLQKVLAACGWGSRRVSEDLIAAGRVTVNGEVAVLGRRVDAANDLIEVDGAPVGAKPGLVHYLLNKPRGVVTTAKDTHGRPTVIELVPAEPRVFPVGRLDSETEGLLLLTNDGDLAHRLQHPSYGVPKWYLAEVPGPVGRDVGRTLKAGIELDDGPVAVDEFSVVDSAPGKALLEIVIHEGRKHVVRRMLEEVGHPVERLVRTRIGSIRLGELPPGRTRPLNAGEVAGLFRDVGL